MVGTPVTTIAPYSWALNLANGSRPALGRSLAELLRVVVQHLGVDFAGRTDLRFIGHFRPRKAHEAFHRALPAPCRPPDAARSRFRRLACKYPRGTTST